KSAVRNDDGILACFAGGTFWTRALRCRAGTHARCAVSLQELDATIPIYILANVEQVAHARGAKLSSLAARIAARLCRSTTVISSGPAGTCTASRRCVRRCHVAADCARRATHATFTTC